MKKILPVFFFVLAFFLVGFLLVPLSFSDELDDINKQISDLTHSLTQSKAATAPLESELRSMQQQITHIKSRVAQLETDIETKKKNIDTSYKQMAEKQKILNRALRDFYMKSYYDSPLLTIMSAASASEVTQVLAYQKAAADQEKEIITNIVLTITDLEIKKKTLESEQSRLALAKVNLDQQSAELDKIVTGAKQYQSKLSGEIAALSAKQQQIVAQKLGSLGLPTSAYTTLGGCSSDIDVDPGFSPRFAVFSYGVPHRVGMSQYGAKGRADAGQNADAILHAYYNFDSYQNSSTTIKVNDGRGYNTGNTIWTDGLEEYVKRIYEVPDSWPIEVLKAQAIAARSYALATTNNGDMSICATQDCQVFKTDPKGGNWDNAVNQTSGQVMIQAGKPIQAWFSSTAGGYEFSSGAVWGGEKPWTKNMLDANGSVSSFSDLQSKAYDKESKWFYCDWGARGDKKTAWLKPEEIADIVNSILLVQADSSADPHILQTDKNDSNTWSESTVKEELRKRRTPFNSISSVNVDADFGSGRTTMVHFSGDAGSADISSDLFKKYFNLRAPANINIVGPLYNVEKR